MHPRSAEIRDRIRFLFSLYPLYSLEKNDTEAGLERYPICDFLLDIVHTPHDTRFDNYYFPSTLGVFFSLVSWMTFTALMTDIPPVATSFTKRLIFRLDVGRHKTARKKRRGLRRGYSLTRERVGTGLPACFYVGGRFYMHLA